MTMTITRLSGSIGARVEGIGLADLDDAAFAAIHRAFLDHCMLVFPGQYLEPDAQLRFASRFGTVLVTPVLTDLQTAPGVLRLSNRGKAEAVTENWHYDSSFLPEPPALTILAAQVLPETGGDTMWSNQYLAYETLSEGLKRMLRGVRGRFCGTRLARKYGAKEIPFSYHPIARVHPETGRTALFVGNPPETLAHFEDMTEEESKPLLDYLYRHSASPDRIYRHVWRPGDVVLWDNRCTMHYAVHDYGDATREMNRVTIRGSVPVG